MTEATRLRADLMVLGGYGHPRIRERLLGGVTYKLLHEAAVPLLVAHYVPRPQSWQTPPGSPKFWR
jgi:nucleotide-binding universal stress UspA family protein